MITLILHQPHHNTDKRVCLSSPPPRDRVGGASLVGAPSSHTTVRTVRYMAVPLTNMHLLVLGREEEVALAGELLGFDGRGHDGAYRMRQYPLRVLANIHAFSLSMPHRCSILNRVLTLFHCFQ